MVMTEATATDVIALRDFTLSALACDECDGADWYARKRRDIVRLARMVGVPDMNAIAIYEVFSQNAGVPENDDNYVRFMLTGDAKGLPERIRRARLALAGNLADALRYKNGHKVPSFFDNLLDPYGSTVGTVDRHAGDILMGVRRLTTNMIARADGAGYHRLEDTYAAVGALLSMTTNEVQAVDWVHHTVCNGGSPWLKGQG